MKRFLDNKIVTAQSEDKGIFGEGWDAMKALPSVLTPLVNPQSPEGQKGTQIENLDDSQKNQMFQRAKDVVLTNIDNKNEAIAIFKQNGKSEYEYNELLDAALKGFSIPNLQFNQYIIGLWPMMQDKNFSFDKFLQIFFLIAKRYKAPSQIDAFFKNFIGVLPGLEKTLGTSDEVIDKAVEFLTEDGGAEKLQEYLLYQMLLRYGLYDEIPQNKKSEIFKATTTLEKVRQNIGPTEAKVQEYLIKRAEFLQQQNEWYEKNSLVFLSIDYYNMDDVKSIFSRGIDDVSIKFYMENLRKGAAFDLYKMSSPLAPNPSADTTTGVPVGKSSGKANSSYKRRVFAEDPEKSAERAGYPNLPSGQTTNRTTDTTDTKTISEEYGELFVLIQQFETTLRNLSSRLDEEIKFITDKQSSSSEIGPFKSGLIYNYIQDEQESIKESDRVIELADQIISDAKETLALTNEKFDRVVNSRKATIRQQQNAETLINEKYNLFVKNIRSKQLATKFNKVLLSSYNDYSEAEDIYENLKIEMKSNTMIRPVIAPKAVVAGFKMAAILETIGEKFKEIAGSNPLRKEQADRTARKFENLAKSMRINVFAEIYPNLAMSIGLTATEPSITPSFSLKGAFVENVMNLRFAGKFMDKEVESDKRFRDYWNNLFMQSKDPRPMGDIIEEKPKHGNLTTEEDAKLHKKTMRKFKKPVSKKPRFKKDNN